MINYYETKSVGAGRSTYWCVCCGGSIPTGSPADNHKFYPEFESHRTHPECSSKFLNGEYCSECGEWHAADEIRELDEDREYACCNECFEELKGEKLGNKVGILTDCQDRIGKTNH